MTYPCPIMAIHVDPPRITTHSCSRTRRQYWTEEKAHPSFRLERLRSRLRICSNFPLFTNNNPLISLLNFEIKQLQDQTQLRDQSQLRDQTKLRDQRQLRDQSQL
ncbi:unnamed protein product [Nesidiocoris tenuis]|uniref:Uncharacterized protein n=1 Tax=Nesidiocoris tenuis TaxID=355587 RepID=A0A6H5GDJ0_9HEMI|nr:unnamed protein product [Nesidiocoris tenuis]